MTLDTFFEKFDLFADAPDAVGKMRELVFQLAVQGRLVQQDRTEESATVLLKRIRAARAELPTNRRSIDETDTTELEEESTLSAAPSGWTWTSLGNVQVFTNGYAFKSEDYQSSGVGIIRMGELGANGEIDERNMKYVTNDIAQSLPETFRVRPGDLLMGMSGSIGKLAINRSDKTYLLNQRVGRLEPILIEKAFLQVFLKTVEQHYLRISFGMAIKNLSTKQINETPFPLPPLAEQKRIVAKVDELMALCDRLEAQQQEREQQHTALSRASLARFADAPTPANLQLLFQKSYTISPADLRKSILTLAVQGKLVAQDPNDEPAEELFGRIERTKEKLITERTIKRVAVEANPSGDECESLPPGWLWTRLGNSFDVRDGTHDTPKYTTEGFPLITSKNIYSGSLLFDGANLISEKDHRQISERSRVDRRDILFAMIGSIGNPVIVDTDREFSIKNVALFKYYTSADSEPRFLLLYLQLVAAEMKAKAAGGVQSFVSLGFLRNYLFPLPPLAEQRRIVAKVDQLMAMVDALETQLAASHTTAKNLLDALVAELTSGSQKAS
jgi:type I restriction enzyme S subunit